LGEFIGAGQDVTEALDFEFAGGERAGPKSRPQQLVSQSRGREVSPVLTVSRLSRWSISYYNDTARYASQAGLDRQRANRVAAHFDDLRCGGAPMVPIGAERSGELDL